MLLQEYNIVFAKLGRFFSKCNDLEQYLHFLDVLKESELPFNVNFHFYNNKVKRHRYLTFKFDLVDGIVKINYYENYYNLIIKEFDDIEFKHCRIYKPKLK